MEGDDLRKWNDTRTPEFGNTCLHHLVERQVAGDPGAPALLTATARISYGRLNNEANRLAQMLGKAGVRPEVPVAVCLERSPDVLVAILAILKAGGVYVPLDPGSPPERRALILADVRPSVVLTRQRFAEWFACQVVVLPTMDAAAPDAPDPDVPNPDVPIIPSNLAYIIYTSGSTGTPKGIAVTHGGAANNLRDLNHRFQVTASDRTLAVSALVFDMSVYDLIGTLAGGGAVVLPESTVDRDPREWARLVTRHQVTIWNSAPALLEMFVDAVEGHRELWPESLRLALLGGDWIPVPLADRLREFAPAARVIALGGATEASVHSTVYEIGVTDPRWPSVPYGRPMANQQAYVLDDSMQPVPAGTVGELYLGGAGLARGYVGRPGLTAERFVPHPLADRPGERLYRTGDQVRHRPDGELQLLGRLDFQVKIAGQRVELAEVATAMLRHPALKDAIVIARVGQARDVRLAAYAIPLPDNSLNLDDLRGFLSPRLPEYMLPVALCCLEEFPLSANGKIDRRALPDPFLAPNGWEPPANDLERLLAALWAELLGVSEVGRNQDFFGLGGQSLAATRLTTWLGDLFPFDIPARAVFAAPTIAKLAVALRSAARSTGADLDTIARIAVSGG